MRRVLVICAHAMTLAAFLCPANAQTFGRNPTVNADAEAGPADANGSAPVSTIPGWNRSGSIDVLTYASGYRLTLTAGQVLPPNHGSNYFSGGPPASLSQTIDLSPAASSIDTGSVTCALSAYLGGLSSDSGTAAITVRFTGASGNALGALQAGPVTSSERSGNTGLLYRRHVGQVPAGTRAALLDLPFTTTGHSNNVPSAHNLPLILNAPAPPQPVLGANLILNGDAEAGPAADALLVAPDVPGW